MISLPTAWQKVFLKQRSDGTQRKSAYFQEIILCASVFFNTKYQLIFEAVILD